ncbi:putative mitotic spindle biogenesis protein Spc19 [Piedraia hortae CBS 480.64]|uniref:DASH complex subunit SPC19 n=1 Tax=Piedraia hortae CBS 480.64 TaxID=1314780 RepID=A0A6A7C1J1_9PEZI|nr:putative mitotic spindle biogenesis protein Spc19 [Piedraia hortae CBS 480.64]
MDSTSTALQGCVASLRTSMQLLSSSISILDSGVNDHPRLCRVLHTERHFELISEHDLEAAQASLRSEITPELMALLSRVEGYLDKLERRQQSLISHAELQEGRLASLLGNSKKAGNGEEQVGKMNTNTKLQIQQFRAKKGRLTSTISRLELEAAHRHRQLRKSMAA